MDRKNFLVKEQLFCFLKQSILLKKYSFAFRRGCRDIVIFMIIYVIKSSYTCPQLVYKQIVLKASDLIKVAYCATKRGQCAREYLVVRRTY